ncbi:related to cholinesterase [Phialocephala subalpina]|uniref:Carboxylic ester hydrolase n=1 Tax=Phialocephala subalpina TaxID=576137 RepID=A0A1L7XA41_9HELO|nr:related to cholinesterase [Phialocephala subalpina]
MVAFVLAVTSACSSDPPVVDLGYALHQAKISSENASYLTFPNIRYAAPPIGSLRFSAPQPPLDNRSAGIQDGSYGKICPQGTPAWSNATLAIAPPGPTESEDCLFLDITVSESTFKQGGAPVVVWIHGGGYIMRSKAVGGSPIGILDRSSEHAEGAVFVAINYRLGAFGWMSGPLFQKSGTANAGLLDQRMTFEWVQKYIHLFGGDCERVTVLGESAGAGAIMHHITAYGGKQGPGKLPFQQAIIQSPSIHNPTKSPELEDELTKSFLDAAGVTTLDEARELSSEALMVANKKVIAPAAFGLYIFQPTIDGDYIPDILGRLLLHGSFDPTINIISAHNSNEGYVYTDPAATNSSALSTYLKIFFPTISPSVLDYVSQVLYPAIYDGSQPYTTPFERLDLLISEMMIVCNSRYISTAKGNQTWNYMFSVGTGHHGADVVYTFYDGGFNDPVANATVAEMMQRYFMSFMSTGDPNAFVEEEGLGMWPKYGSEASVVDFNGTFVDIREDPAKDSRCDWWQLGLYL